VKRRKSNQKVSGLSAGQCLVQIEPADVRAFGARGEQRFRHIPNEQNRAIRSAHFLEWIDLNNSLGIARWELLDCLRFPSHVLRDGCHVSCSGVHTISAMRRKYSEHQNSLSSGALADTNGLSTPEMEPARYQLTAVFDQLEVNWITGPGSPDAEWTVHFTQILHFQPDSIWTCRSPRSFRRPNSSVR